MPKNSDRLDRSDAPADTGQERPKRPKRPYYPPQPRRVHRPTLDVDALLRHAADPNVDLLAEAEREIGEDLDTQETAGRTGPTPDLTNPVTLRAILRRHGLRPNKSFGQNFLLDRQILQAIIAAAELEAEENVLEVGSGTGALTVELAQRARRIVAVELDRNILPVLRETTTRLSNVAIVPRDLLEIEPQAIFGGEPYKLVANLPYYITALTLRHFLEAATPPRLLVVMVQKEVAERITAGPGDLSLLGLSVQFYGTPRIISPVPASAFYPPPRVDSAIIRVDLFPEPPLASEARTRFFGIAHAGFAEKRKQLHNSLARNLKLPQETVSHWLAEAGIDPARRAEMLSLDDWLRLTRIALADAET